MYSGCILFIFRTAGEKELKSFLSDPEAYVGEATPIHLPSSGCLPQIKTELEVKEMFPRQYEMQGFCPVTYIDGKKRLTLHVYTYISSLLY